MKFKFWSFLFLMTILAACSSKVEDVNDEDGNATFEFDRIQVVSSESIASDTNWPDIKDRFVVDLRACFKDTVYLQSIVGEDFAISSELNSYERTTDANGCLNWTEEIKFNYLMDESYIKISGDVIGEGNYKGLKKYSLALNPWSGKVVDLAHGSANNIVEVDQFSKMNFEGNALEVEDFSVEVVEKEFLSNQTKIKLDLITTPQITRRDVNGAVIKEKLSGGEFLINYYIIQKSLKNGSREYISKAQSKDTVRRDGRLNSVVEFEINRSLDPNSIIELGVEIAANDPELSMGRDSGVMAIKDLDLRFSGKLLDLKLDYAELQSLKDNEQPLDDLSDESFGFLIDRVKIARGAEGGANLVAINTDRRVNAVFNINMLDSLILKGIKNHTFKVKLVELSKNKSEIVVHEEMHSTMSSSGEMQFTASIPFKSYDVRTYKKYKVIIDGIKAPFRGLTKERIVYINPWISGAEFGIDSKYGVPQKADSDNIPRIFMPEISYNFIGNVPNKFRLNRGLDLLISKELRFEFSPELKVDHDYNANPKGYEPIVSGKYKMRVLILTPKDKVNYTQRIDLNDFMTLTASEKDVTPESGVIRANMQFPMMFSEQLYYGYRNILLIELSPLEVDAELQKGYFVGTFSGLKDGGTIKTLDESGQSITTANIDIANTLIAEMNKVNNKLPDDSIHSGNFNRFLKKIKSIKDTVTIFDYSTLKTKQKETLTRAYTSADSVKRAFALTASVDELNKMIIDPMKTPPKALDDLCHLLFNKNAQFTQTMTSSGPGGYSHSSTLTETGYLYKKCKKDPIKFIEFKQVDHIEKITKQPNSFHAISQKINSNSAYFTSEGDYFTEGRGERETRYTQKSLSLNLGAEFSKFGLFGGVTGSLSTGTRNDTYVYNQHSNTVSTQFRTMNSSGMTFKYDKFHVEFEANIRRCTLFAAKTFEEELPKKYIHAGSFFIKRKKAHMTSHQRYYLCSKDIASNVTTGENWYYIATDNDGAMVDDRLATNTLAFVMRGDSSFHHLRREQLRKDEDIIFNKSKQKSAYLNFQNYLNKTKTYVEIGDEHEVGFPGMMD